MLIRQEAFDTVPCEGSETISSTPGSMRAAPDGLANASPLLPRAVGAACRALGVASEGRGRTVRAARSPPDLPTPPGEPVTTGGLGLGPLVPGGVGAESGHDARAVEGKQRTLQNSP